MFAEIIGNSEVVCVQAEGVFRCLVDYDDNFFENPTEAAVVLCLNGPLLCRRGKFVPKDCHVWLQGGCQLALFYLFSTVSCRCFLEGS